MGCGVATLPCGVAEMGMTEPSDSKLIQMARQVARVSATSAASLATHGYKPEQATQLSALADKLDKAVDAI